MVIEKPMKRSARTFSSRHHWSTPFWRQRRQPMRAGTSPHSEKPPSHAEATQKYALVEQFGLVRLRGCGQVFRCLPQWSAIVVDGLRGVPGSPHLGGRACDSIHSSFDSQSQVRCVIGEGHHSVLSSGIMTRYQHKIVQSNGMTPRTSIFKERRAIFLHVFLEEKEAIGIGALDSVLRYQ